MPIIKSAIKRVRQTAKRRSHNLMVKRAIHDDVRALQTAITSGNIEAIVTAHKAAQSEIDRAVKKGTLHRNTAARRKSQLAASIASLTPSETTPKPKSTKAAAKKPAAKKPVAKKAPAKPAA